jgi:tetratricopeptide (TPR) repeat protein
VNKAKSYAKIAFKLSTDNKHYLIQTKSCRALAYLYDISNQLDSANIFYHYGIRIGLTHNFKDRVIDLYNDLGLLHDRLDVYDSALHYYFLSYNLASQIQSYKDEAIACHNIGLVYSHLQNYDEALAHFTKTVDIKIKHGIAENLNLNLTNIASILNEKGLHKEAMLHLRKVEANCKNGCDEITLADLYFEFGYSYLKKGLLTEAYDFLIQALNHARKGDSRQTIANSLYQLSYFPLNREAYPEAISYLHEAETIALEISHRRLLRDIYQQLSIIYTKTGSIEKAMHYQTRFIELKDSIFNKNVANNLKNIQLSQHRKQSNQIIQEKESALWKSNFVAIFLTVNCILALAIIYLVYRSLGESKRTKKQMEIELIKLLDERDKNQKELYRSRMEFSSLLNRVTGFLLGPIATLLGLSNVSKGSVTFEEANEYLNKIRDICSRHIMGVFHKITELHTIREQEVVIENVGVANLSERIYNNFKTPNDFSLLTITVQKSMPATLRTDYGLITTLISSGIRYFNKPHDVSPIEVNFEQHEASVTITIKNHCNPANLIPYENLFNLFVAQVTAWKLKGDTALTERNDHALLKIFIPTDYTLLTTETVESTVLMNGS